MLKNIVICMLLLISAISAKVLYNAVSADLAVHAEQGECISKLIKINVERRNIETGVDASGKGTCAIKEEY